MKPLAGLKIIELCEFVSGPFAGMLLADMGADLVKVEPPGGDSFRGWPPFVGEESLGFAALNRNKRSIALDLKDPRDADRARQLLLSADAVLENYRPGVMAKFGLDYSALSQEKPSLVFCSISGFGQHGPRALEGGFDMTIQAMSGVMSVTGEAQGGPVKCGVPLTDFGTALYAAFAIVSALRKAALTGIGEHIDVSLLGSTLAMSALQVAEYFSSGGDPERLGSASPRAAPYQAFKAADGHIVIAAGNDGLWKGVCQAVGCMELYEDSRFSTNRSRATNRETLCSLLEQRMAGLSVEHLERSLKDHGVPCAPINQYSKALQDPQVSHMDWISSIPLREGKTARIFGNPIRMTHQDLGVQRFPPGPGEHSTEVLEEIGLGSASAKGNQR